MNTSAEFEAWVAAQPGDFDLAIQGARAAWPGQYKDYITQCAWVGFRAGQLAGFAEAKEAAVALTKLETGMRHMGAKIQRLEPQL